MLLTLKYFLIKIDCYLYERIYIYRFPYIVSTLFQAYLPGICKSKYQWKDEKLSILKLNNITAPIDLYSGHDKEKEYRKYRKYGLRFDSNQENKILISDNVIKMRDNLKDADTYSVCEFVVNLCYFIDQLLPQERAINHEKYLSIMNSLGMLILRNIEYRRSYTNNHIINNARALIYVGCFTENKVFYGIGLSLAKRFIERLSCDGVFFEGSSHYQLIFNLWLFDIRNCISKKVIGCKVTRQYFDGLLSNGIQSIEPLLLNETNANFGDISPDFSFDQIVELNKRISRLEFFYKIQKDDCFSKKNIVRQNFEGLAHLKGFCWDVFTWSSFKSNQMKIKSHHHSDIMGFIMSYEKKIKVFDSGRRSYDKGDSISQMQKSEFGHSSLKFVKTDNYNELKGEITVSDIKNSASELKFSGIIHPGNHIISRVASIEKEGVKIVDSSQNISNKHFDFHLRQDFLVKASGVFSCNDYKWSDQDINIECITNLDVKRYCSPVVISPDYLDEIEMFRVMFVVNIEKTEDFLIEWKISKCAE